MSMPSNTKITCPKCNHESDYIVWYSINVTLNPEMKDKILGDTLFSWVCPHCGERFYAPYDFLLWIEPASVPCNLTRWSQRSAH